MVLTTLVVHMHQVLEYGGVPDTAIIRVYRIVTVIRLVIAQTLERQTVVNVVQELTQDGRLCVTADLCTTLDHPPEYVIVHSGFTNRQVEVISSDDQ